MSTLGDLFKEEAMPLCTCTGYTKAFLYCDRGCKPDSFYYCFKCGSIHDHKNILIADATTENLNISMTLRQDVNEFYEKI